MERPEHEWEGQSKTMKNLQPKSVMNHSHQPRKSGRRQRSLIVALLAGAAAFSTFGPIATAAHIDRSARQMDDDKAVSGRVRSALDADAVKFPDVHVMTYRGVTQLSGFVDTGDHKDRAGDIAKRILGGSARLENSLSVKNDARRDKATSMPERSAGERVDDKKINAAVREALSSDSLKYPEVGIATYRGTVQLAGFVTESEQKKHAGEIAKKIPGVKDVENNITVVEPM